MELGSFPGRGIYQEEFLRLPGHPFVEELDLPLEKELATDLVTYTIEKEVVQSMVHHITEVDTESLCLLNTSN